MQNQGGFSMPKMKGADENERDKMLFGGCADGCALEQAMYDARCRKNDIADKVQGLCRSQSRLQKRCVSLFV